MASIVLSCGGELQAISGPSLILGDPYKTGDGSGDDGGGGEGRVREWCAMLLPSPSPQPLPSSPRPFPPLPPSTFLCFIKVRLKRVRSDGFLGAGDLEHVFLSQ